MPNNIKKLEYKPKITYKEDWSTERGSYVYTYNEDENIESESIIEIPPDTSIDERINEINRLMYNDAFPKQLAHSINEVYKPLIDTYEKYIKGQPIYKMKKESFYIENDIDNKPKYGLFIRNKTLTLKVGSSKTLNVFLIPTNDKTNYIKKWESSNEDVAYVDENGTVYGLSKGRVIIKATSTYDKSDECIIDVIGVNNDIPIDDSDNSSNDDDDDNDNNNDEEPYDTDYIIDISEIKLSRTHVLVKKGEKRQLYVSIHPKNATNKILIWSSNKNNIAVISSNGIVTGVSVGTCMITVSSINGKYDTCYVTVVDDNTNKPNKDEPSDTLIDDDDDDTGDDDTGDDDNPDNNPPDDGGNGGYKPTPVVPVVLVIPEIDPTPFIIENEFKHNTKDIIDFYTESLIDILNNFYSSLLATIFKNIKSNKDMSMLLNNINISNKDIVSSFGHLLDSCLKNEKKINVKTSFLSNNFNFSYSLYHIKDFLISYELRKKYESIPYVSNSDIDSSKSNTVLKTIKTEYSLKYDNSYRNLYRYLNSSLRICSQIVTDISNAIIAKGILIEKGGINK